MMGSLPHAVSRNCIEKTQALQAQARRAQILICYSATVFRPGYVEVSDRNKIFSQRKRSGQPAIADPLAVIHAAVKPMPGEPVVGKHRVNAFYGTDLGVILTANDVDTLVILGYATSGVVHRPPDMQRMPTTAWSSWRTAVLTDAAVHDFLCQKIFPRQADVVSSTDVIRALLS
jgi:isochorismate hydrolase